MTTPEELVEAKVAEAKSPEKFDLKATLAKKATFPTHDEKIYIDGENAHRVNVLLDELQELEFASRRLKETEDGIVDSPEKVEIDEKIEAKTGEYKELLALIESSSLTFTLRGIVPKQWRLIDSTWRRKIKQPVRSDFASDEDFETEVIERNIQRNAKIQQETVAKAIVKVTDADGNEDTSAWTVDDAEGLYDNLYESQWNKLNNLAANLTFAHTLFNQVVPVDADFLPKR